MNRSKIDRPVVAFLFNPTNHYGARKDLIEAAPSLISKVDLKKAEQIKKLLNEAGAKVTLKK